MPWHEAHITICHTKTTDGCERERAQKKNTVAANVVQQTNGFGFSEFDDRYALEIVIIILPNKFIKYCLDGNARERAQFSKNKSGLAFSILFQSFAECSGA